MTIMQVLYMLEIARYGNMSKAADCLFVSQPALSLQIKNLEAELGCMLFHREPQGVSLTAAGRTFCEDASLVEKAWGRLQQGTKLLGNAVCHHVRVGVGARAFSNGLFDAVASFFESHAETSVTYITDIGDNMLDALEEKRIDLAVDRLPPAVMVRHPDRFSVFELLRERQCVLFSYSDPRATLPAFPFHDLHGSSVVSGPVGSIDDHVMQCACLKYGVQIARLHRADNMEAVMALIRSGKGVALGSRSFAERYQIAAVPMLPETYIALNLICLKQNSANPLARQLKRFLADVCKRQNNQA